MRAAMAIMTIGCVLATSVPAVQPGAGGAVENDGVTFAAIDVTIDAGNTPLAAYQVEIRATAGDVTFVGVEGGEHAAFAEPPYYDPKALAQDRLILAAFNTGDDLPSGATRVARVHVRIVGDVVPEYAVTLPVAADRDGEPIEAEVTVDSGVQK